MNNAQLFKRALCSIGRRNILHSHRHSMGVRWFRYRGISSDTNIWVGPVSIAMANLGILLFSCALKFMCHKKGQEHSCVVRRIAFYARLWCASGDVSADITWDGCGRGQNHAIRNRNALLGLSKISLGKKNSNPKNSYDFCYELF